MHSEYQTGNELRFHVGVYVSMCIKIGRPPSSTHWKMENRSKSMGSGSPYSTTHPCKFQKKQQYSHTHVSSTPTPPRRPMVTRMEMAADGQSVAYVRACVAADVVVESDGLRFSGLHLKSSESGDHRSRVCWVGLILFYTPWDAYIQFPNMMFVVASLLLRLTSATPWGASILGPVASVPYHGISGDWARTSSLGILVNPARSTGVSADALLSAQKQSLEFA